MSLVNIRHGGGVKDLHPCGSPIMLKTKMQMGRKKHQACREQKKGLGKEQKISKKENETHRGHRELKLPITTVW